MLRAPGAAPRVVARLRVHVAHPQAVAAVQEAGGVARVARHLPRAAHLLLALLHVEVALVAALAQRLDVVEHLARRGAHARLVPAAAVVMARGHGRPRRRSGRCCPVDALPRRHGDEALVAAGRREPGGRRRADAVLRLVVAAQRLRPVVQQHAVVGSLASRTLAGCVASGHEPALALWRVFGAGFAAEVERGGVLAVAVAPCAKHGHAHARGLATAPAGPKQKRLRPECKEAVPVAVASTSAHHSSPDG